MKALEIPLLVLTCSQDDATSLDMMTSLAQQHLSQRFFVGVMTDSASAGTGPPLLTAYNMLDETIPTYRGPFESNALLEFADNVSSPLIRQFDAFALRTSIEVKGLQFLG